MAILHQTRLWQFKIMQNHTGAIPDLRPPCWAHPVNVGPKVGNYD